MTKKTISELDDIGLTQEDTAVCAIEQNGATFKAPVRPNPSHQVNVSSEAQLIARFGSQLLIPDNEEFTIYVDESFELSIPFKIGTDSILEVSSEVVGHTLTYTGTGALFQNFNSTNLINRVIISNLTFIGESGNSFINIQSDNRVSLSNIGIFNFGNLGDISATNLIDLSQVSASNYDQGLRLDDALVIICRDLGTLNLSANTDPTFLSIIDGSESMKIFLNTIEGKDGNGGDSLFFLDPNLGSNSNVVITESFMSSGSNFYQPGTDITITGTAVGSPGTLFTTSVDHNLSIGDIVSLRNFSDPNYNGVFTVTGVGPGVIFEVNTPFGVSEAGAMDVSIISVSDGSTSPTTFTTNLPHNLEVGYAVVLKNFTGPGDPNYNKTFVVSAKTATTFDIDITDEGTTDVGTLSAASLNQTDPKITAALNPGQARSVIFGGFFIPAQQVTGITGSYADFDFSGTPVISLSGKQRVSLVNPNIGEIRYDGLNDATVKITFPLPFDADGDGTAGTFQVKFLINRGAGYVDIPQSPVSMFSVKDSNDAFTATVSATIDVSEGDLIKPQIIRTADGRTIIDIENARLEVTDA